MSQGVKITFVLNLKPELSEQISAGFAEALKDTRAFDGCRSVNIYKNDEDPNKILLLEEWDSREHYEKYLAWRNKDGAMDNIGAVLTSPAKPEYWPTLIA
jgi:quinol monooxygenase YgiN